MEELIPDYKTIFTKSYRLFITDKRLLTTSAIVISLSFTTYFTFWTGQRLLQVFGLLPIGFVIIRWVDSILGTFINHHLPVLKKRLSESKLLIISAALDAIFITTMGILLFLLKYTHNPVIIWFIAGNFVLLANSNKLIVPTIRNILQSLIPSSIRATALSFVNLSGSLGRGALNPLVGFLADLNVIFTYIAIILIKIFIKMFAEIKLIKIKVIPEGKELH